MRASTINILTNPARQWCSLRAAVQKSNRYAFRDLKVDWSVYNIDDYLFTHDTIVASVATEANGYTIKPSCADLVNANGNAWTNEVLLHSYKTFIGGENYTEHVQLPSLSKGKILDAIIREVTHNGEKVYMVDILVATSRRHRELVERIERGELNTLSMGATAQKIQCSICGRIFDTVKEEKVCSHLRDHVGEYIEVNGQKRICAELCGAMDPITHEYIKDSCVFIEASWVEQPAFKGAVTNYLIETPEVKARRVTAKNLEKFFQESLSSSRRVADRSGWIVQRILADCTLEDRVAAEVARDFLN